MEQLRGDADLLQESLGSDGSGDFRPQNLDRDITIVPDVVSGKYFCHPTAADLPRKLIPVG
jgi:hypothetical protein